MSIQLLVDIYSDRHSSESFHVFGDQTCMDACRLIDKAINDGTSLHIVLHNQAIISWFDSYKGRIEITYFDPCKEFSKALEISEQYIPIEVLQDPKWIVYAGLIDKAKISPLKVSQKVSSWILEQLLDEVWSLEEINSYDSLIKIIKFITTKQSIHIHPTLLALRNSRIQTWKQKSKLKKIIEWIFTDDSKKRAESLVFARLIWNYPYDTKLKALQFGNRWSEISILEDFPSILEQMPLHDLKGVSLPLEISCHIEEYLANALQSSGLESIINILAGIKEEEAPIKSFLEKNFNYIDSSWNNILSILSNIFSKNDMSDSFICYLQKLIPIKKPTLLNLNSTWDEVTTWLDNDYFPYYRWCCELDKVINTEESSKSFENWLHKNYYELTKQNGFAPYNILSILTSSVSEASLLFVIIDALPWYFNQSLQEKLYSNGLKFIDTSMHITTIPTITRISKPCLIRGQLPGQLPPECDSRPRNYTELFATSLDMNIEDVCYSNSNEADIFSIVQSKKKAYLYLYNDIDEVVHKQCKPDRRNTLIDSQLNNITTDIVKAVEYFKSKYGSELNVVISSDHGFTEIPEDAEVIKLEDNECSIDHNKILISREGCASSPEDYFYISSEMLGGEHESYYVTKGFKYIDSKPKGASHGGLSPQEVIIPIIRIDSSIDVTFNKMSISFVGDVRRGKSQNMISVELYNPNSVPILLKKVDFRLVSLQETFPKKIQPREMLTLSAYIDASHIKEEIVSITGLLLMSYRGKDILDDIQYTIKTSGAALSDKSFEDDFDV